MRKHLWDVRTGSDLLIQVVFHTVYTRITNANVLCGGVAIACTNQSTGS